ncbi:MAG: hypothetical protein COS35_06595 [Zetaproteobacteria bacterium CG02_land_8_20_14_3_00_50_9]|nr:MAG: hypothetical protein AUJ57_00140 [Zetaproteobacteria bacterium CG1_02_53_45]PIV30505.1 MAG: hypothetical protein COS35_06595 [Zetaproteobacteria bacterium CG02_land_8_20_14_3_00_50_9]PIY56791.1 MAG: hypothetical protein COZ00_02385 [Zetaproteobacteria bacterium CG_4_10_14_0_8_um_filter_49_80]
MKPVQIKAALILTGRSQIDIANDLGVHVSRVNEVINNRSANKRIRIAIAKIVEKDVKAIWPDEAYRRPNGRIIEPARAAA